MRWRRGVQEEEQRRQMAAAAARGFPEIILTAVMFWTEQGERTRVEKVYQADLAQNTF